MKTLNLLLVTLFVALSINQGISQTVIAVVDFMKVENNNNAKYLEVEKKWKKIHETAKKEGMIADWDLYQVMFTGTSNAYNYATVRYYTSFGQLENPFSQELMSKSYPDYKDADWQSLMNDTGSSRNLITSEVYTQALSAETTSEEPVKYVTINRMSVPSGGGNKYVGLEKDVYKPMHEESIKQGNRVGWGVWSKYPGDFTEFQFVTTDVYSSMDQMGSGGSFSELFEKVHPGKDPAEINKMTNESRTMMSAELWKLIDTTQGQ